MMPPIEKKILIFGNSHIQFFRRALQPLLLEHYSKENQTYVMSNFVEPEWHQFDQNSYLREIKFQPNFGKPIHLKGAKLDLVIIGECLLGSSLVRPFGGYASVPAHDKDHPRKYTPKLPLIKGQHFTITPEHSLPAQLKWRIQLKQIYRYYRHMRNLKSLIKNGNFNSIIWVAGPDMTEQVARHRFGDDFVESGLYAKHREIDRSAFFGQMKRHKLEKYFLLHSEDDILPSGFSDNKFKPSKDPSDVHVHPVFFEPSAHKVIEHLKAYDKEDAE